LSILIDGHNLIGQSPDLTLADPDDEARLVQRLKVYRSIVREPITVIFDSGASYVPPHKLSGGGVEVVFAELGSSADKLIISRIERCRVPRELLVVSSDRDIQVTARARGTRMISAQDFAAEMSKTHGPKRKKPKRPSPEPGLSAHEVTEWLDLFSKRPKR